MKPITITMQGDRLSDRAESITFSDSVSAKLREIDTDDAYINIIDSVMFVLGENFPAMEFEQAEAYAPIIVALLEEEQYEPDGS